MKCRHVNDGVNRIQKQVLSNIALIPSIAENSRKNYICVKNTKSAKIIQKYAPTLPKSGSRGDSGLASMSNVCFFIDFKKLLNGIRKRR